MATENRVVNAQDIGTIVSLVGRAGAIQALSCSDVVKADDLKCLARALGMPVAPKTPKKEVARQVVRRIDRRIEKSVAELRALDRRQIYSYLDETGCDADELRELLEQARLPVQTKMSRHGLIDFAAIEISSLGMFDRIANDRHAES